MADRIMKDYFYFNRGGQTLCVEVLHYANNLYAAKKAMLNTYGLKESDIIRSSFSTPNAGISYSTFDGTRYH